MSLTLRLMCLNPRALIIDVPPGTRSGYSSDYLRPARRQLHALLLGVAVGADSVQFHLVPSQRNAEIARDDVLHALDRGVLELDDPAAALADEMIVMAFADRFVARLALVKMALVQQLAFLEQPQRPVDRRIADVRVDLLDLRVQFFGADMMPVLEEDARDVVALAG